MGGFMGANLTIPGFELFHNGLVTLFFDQFCAFSLAVRVAASLLLLICRSRTV
jgi:hypothetical protein